MENADGYGDNTFYITPKKAGKTKVTFQYKKKTYTISVQDTYWENPCKTFQIGKTNYSKYLNTFNKYSLSQQNKSKVTIRGGKRAPGMLSVVAQRKLVLGKIA